jgi:xanthine dehydrogenase accessory factor
MDSSDIQVLAGAIEWLQNGANITLVTVAQTWGSSPRPPGAWAVLRNDGTVMGSVSGGCIEEDLIRRVRDGVYKGTMPEILTYGVSKDEATRFGLPCGGTLQLVVEPAPDLANLQLLQRRITEGLMTARTVDIASGYVMLENAARNDPVGWDGKRLTTVHGPRVRLLIIGAGQLSVFLASMAQALDYAVTVCDPREEYSMAWQVPAVHLVTTMPDDAVTTFRPDSASAIVALTHDPKLDDLALIEALRSPAFYVGALGSRVNTAKRKERLTMHFGLTQAELERLHGPVGLRIGSRTPPEIAISILAEMTAVRNGVDLTTPPVSRDANTATSACAAT